MSELTLGQQLVGTYTPSDIAGETNQALHDAHELMARAADLLFEDFNKRLHNGTLSHESLYATIHNHALGEILNAKMNIVKVITFK